MSSEEKGKAYAKVRVNMIVVTELTSSTKVSFKGINGLGNMAEGCLSVKVYAAIDWPVDEAHPIIASLPIINSSGTTMKISKY
jgi:hypothetical protein